jgi:hypothetical protein
MEPIEWLRETERLAGEHVEAAFQAATKGDAPACADASGRAAMVFLRRYLEAVGGDPSGCDVVSLLDAAAQRDHYFSRLRPEVRLLQVDADGAASGEDILDAMMEIQFLAGFRAGRALGFTVEPDHRDPRLVPLVTHSTSIENAGSIFACGALYSFNWCVRHGLLSGTAKGVTYLRDPRRYQESVLFHIPDHRYLAGEMVSNSERKGYADEAMEEDYQPGVRLFFRKEELESLPARDDDGSHLVMVRDQVSLDLLVCAVFPSEQARDKALARVKDPERREWLAARCLVAPVECCGAPQDYVRVTNQMVAERFL